MHWMSDGSKNTAMENFRGKEYEGRPSPHGRRNSEWGDLEASQLGHVRGCLKSPLDDTVNVSTSVVGPGRIEKSRRIIFDYILLDFD